jgi:hypothetical protein
MNWTDANNLTNTAINLGSMPPALMLTYSSLVNQYCWLKPVVDQNRKVEK